MPKDEFIDINAYLENPASIFRGVAEGTLGEEELSEMALIARVKLSTAGFLKAIHEIKPNDLNIEETTRLFEARKKITEIAQNIQPEYKLVGARSPLIDTYLKKVKDWQGKHLLDIWKVANGEESVGEERKAWTNELQTEHLLREINYFILKIRTDMERSRIARLFSQSKTDLVELEKQLLNVKKSMVEPNDLNLKMEKALKDFDIKMYEKVLAVLQQKGKVTMNFHKTFLALYRYIKEGKTDLLLIKDPNSNNFVLRSGVEEVFKGKDMIPSQGASQYRALYSSMLEDVENAIKNLVSETHEK